MKKLVAITLDEASIGRGTPDQEHEREIAIYDLIEENVFGFRATTAGPIRSCWRSTKPSSRSISAPIRATRSSPPSCRSRPSGGS